MSINIIYMYALFVTLLTSSSFGFHFEHERIVGRARLWTSNHANEAEGDSSRFRSSPDIYSDAYRDMRKGVPSAPQLSDAERNMLEKKERFREGKIPGKVYNNNNNNTVAAGEEEEELEPMSDLDILRAEMKAMLDRME